MSTTLNPERYLVIGGSGFLGSYVVRALVAKEGGGHNVASFDLAEPLDDERVGDVDYRLGDMVDFERLVTVLKEVRTFVIRDLMPSLTNFTLS
jgi:sterol-4alpha-carboxylate 3-dehydrogenase (decarboxylating)